MKVPCKDCHDRTIECHIKGNCEKWDEYTKEHEKEQKEKRAAIDKRIGFIEMQKARDKRIRQHTHK